MKSNMSEKETGLRSVRLSVVVPCLNEAETLAVQLEALARQQWSEPWEVVFADNGSTDGSLQIAESYRARLPALQIIDASDRKGAPHAINRGVAAARGSMIAFCDGDDEAAEGWVRAMGEALMEHDFVAGPWEVDRLNPPWLAAARENPQPNGLQRKHQLPYAGAGNMGIRKEVFEAVGGFDESCRYLFEVDFCWRVQQETEAELTYAPEAVMHVRYRHSFVEAFRQARNYSEAKHRILERYGLAEAREPVSWQELWSLFRVTAGELRRVRSRSDLYRWAWKLGWSLGEVRSRSLSAEPTRRAVPGEETDRMLFGEDVGKVTGG